MKPQTRSRSARFALGAASAMIALTPSVATPASTSAAVTAHAHRASKMRLPQTTGARAMTAPAPTLDSLPDALWQGQASHAPLTIALPGPVSPTALRAAILAAGAAQQGGGANGLDVRVLEHATPRQIDAAPGSVIVVDERAGAATLSLANAPRAGVRLTIAGAGTGLLSAARLLSAPAIHAFNKRSTTVPDGLVAQVTQDPAPSSVTVRPTVTSGSGSQRLTTEFTLPLDRQLTGDTTLQILTGYDAPGGGRVTARLQGGVLSSAEIPASGTTRATIKAKLSDTPALTGDTLPGWWAHPGANQITLSASPNRPGASGTLQLLRGSRVALQTTPRPATLQLGLWPFPIYNDHAWSRATVVLDADPGAHTLSALIAALANTERITGIAPDPQVALGAPTAAQAQGDLLLAGDVARSAGAGQIPTLRGVHATQDALPGTLEEVRLPHGGVALLADGARALTALGAGYSLGSVSGRAALVDSSGHAHTLAAGETIHVYTQPRLPWVAPLALLAVLALGWVGVRTVRAQRRLVSMPAFETTNRGGAS